VTLARVHHAAACHAHACLPAGTYIFALSERQCVDATRAGNMAHLINHSCAPCCHSRTITVRCPRTQQLVDRVVICASRDIAVGAWCSGSGCVCGRLCV
jgi:hypothetical protein